MKENKLKMDIMRRNAVISNGVWKEKDCSKEGCKRRRETEKNIYLENDATRDLVRGSAADEFDVSKLSVMRGGQRGKNRTARNHRLWLTPPHTSTSADVDKYPSVYLAAWENTLLYALL